jgi:serine/threonine protein kinase
MIPSTFAVLSGHLASEKSDVYAYAIVLWEILTRKAPFSDVKSFEEFLDGTTFLYLSLSRARSF